MSMQFYSFSQISDSEREDILSKHREVYNGYQTMQPKVNNTQPLYVQDFAKDKSGAMVNNDGSVGPYTNYRINESHVMDTCEQCGGNLTEKECMECGWKMEETKEGYKTGKLDDIYDEEDLNMSDDFDYVEGGGNDYGTFEKMHHMKSIKNEATATSNAPLSYGKHYNEIDEPYDFKSNGPVGDGGTLRQKSIEEGGYTGGGNAPDFDIDFESPAYDFESNGPIEDTYTEPADDMDLDSEKVQKPFDFVSDGPEIGDVYPVFEDMTSAWAEDDIEGLPDMETEKNRRSSLEIPDMETEKNRRSSLEIPDMESEKNRRSSLEIPDMETEDVENDKLDEVDISGAQASQERAKKPFAFVSTGPGKAGPYQTHSWGGEQLSTSLDEQPEDEDAYRENDLEDGELDLDLTVFNPEDKSWEEITAHTGDDEFSYLGEEQQNSLRIQKDKILEMFIRFKKFN